MGKINEYQRKQLASSAVGVATPNKSGNIIGSTVAKIGGAIATRQEQLADTYTDMQANSAIMQFTVAFQNFGFQAQREMAANPDKYTERLTQGGSQMVEEFTAGIQDDQVRAKFLQGANTVVRAAIVQSPQWANAQKKNNATVAAEQAIRYGVIQAGKTFTVDQLKQSITTVETMASKEIPETIISGPEKDTFLKKNMPGTLDSHFSNRIQTDPKTLIKELDAGVYDNVSYFTNDMKVKYRKQAEAKIRNNDTFAKEAQTNNYATLSDELLAEQLTFERIDAMVTAEKEEDSISAIQAVRLKKGLVLQVESDATKLVNDNKKAKKYIKLVKDVIDNRVERAEITEQIVEAYTMGIASREESQFFSKTLAEIKTTKGTQRADEWKKAVTSISKKAQQIGGEVETRTATAMRNFISQMVSGVPTVAATQNAMNRMATEKVLEDNPFLSSSKEPIEDAYRLRAINALRQSGYPVSKTNIEAVIAQYKTEDDTE